MRATVTDHGIEWGDLKFQCLHDDDNKGWVVARIVTSKHKLTIYVTKTGHLRVWADGSEVFHGR